MLQVENKLELFEDVVYKRRLLDLENRKEAWREEKENLLERKRKQLAEEKEQIVRRRENLARVLGNEKIARAREDERVLELEKINALKVDFMKAIRDRVRAYTKTEAYPEYLFKEVEASLDHLEPGEYFLGMVKEDIDRYFEELNRMAKEKGFILHPRVLKDDRIGGHTLVDMEESYSLNYDFASKIHEKRYEIGKVLYRLFRKEMEHA